MFQTTKLSPDSLQFIATVNQSGKTRSKATSIAVAKALSNTQTIPSTIVDDIKQFYNSNFSTPTTFMLGMLNEVVPVDTTAISEYCFKFYQFRYLTANPESHVLAINKETAIVDFFKITKIFDTDSLNAISEDPIYVTSLCNNFAAIIEQLKTES